eukprot:gb/GEZN01018563.1/.p1 GENE.gb/GEZN01018563.1/~~gb/GEZN01018563.1/.p1  ORF type:complete len:108 (-),score=33.32 gb/GEZN01018563.1/:320-643(-)
MSKVHAVTAAEACEALTLILKQFEDSERRKRFKEKMVELKMKPTDHLLDHKDFIAWAMAGSTGEKLATKFKYPNDAASHAAMWAQCKAHDKDPKFQAVKEAAKKMLA